MIKIKEVNVGKYSETDFTISLGQDSAFSGK